ncbi:MAG: restriction endonuclease subunit S [Candidatus Moraniibacteriota bacterium]
MPNKIFLQNLGFLPRNNASGIFYKNYKIAENYCIEVDLEGKKFNFGNKIKSESGTTLNFSQEENWVVFECVNRLLEKGYKPKDITLEKIYPTGHGTSGRLDILVKKNKRAYLMIECKTWGLEFEKAFKKLQKDGGQLFTYFQQDRNAEYLMLYASNFDGKEISLKNEIIKIEEHYREAGNVKDFFDRWNKLSKQNGIFDEWVNAYEFQSRALQIGCLDEIKEDDAKHLFNSFASILRKHVVSDKPNAFNKIFNLFLCKIRDEYDDKNKTREANFQWKDDDTQEKFQSRLNRMYKEGMKIFLNKDIVDFDEEDLNKKFPEIADSPKLKEEMMRIINEIRFKKSNEFAIKEVHDQKSFEENAVVLKELVELIQKYRIRYDKRHPYLSDFFELLLTTGLKQESGQFFTPLPIARFIIKSLPIKEKVKEKLKNGNFNDLLPAIIDYAAGSGHFLHESMHELQTIIDNVDTEKFDSEIKNEISGWKIGKFRWAKNYIYGIEKDYRLTKVAKVGCYLHGDGLAQVIHGDGLDDFYLSKDYEGLLRKQENQTKNKDNQVFDFVISNPPYSVASFKANLKNIFESFGENNHSFNLYNYLTDQSSEIECLFIERTKQLLKEGGVAGIILPSSILSNTGIYTKAREILLKYFEIIGITELGSGTFMATGTTTNILFLRRRTNYEWENIKNSVDNFFSNFKDITVNGVENIFSKYVKHVWDKVGFEDFVSLCQGNPNNNLKKHDIYKEYEKKIKAKNEEEKQKIVLEIEKEKLLYFILAYPQKIVIVKSGKKKEEKAFLGYEFSNRRGYEGIHPIQRSKTIDDCTKMFDPLNQDNSEKANSYIYKAFLNGKNLEVVEPMKKHVFYSDLIDMMTFDRVDFEKTISLTLKKTSKIESKWEIVRLGENDVCKIIGGFAFKSENLSDAKHDKFLPVIKIANIQFGKVDIENVQYHKYSDDLKKYLINKNDILVAMTGATVGKVGISPSGSLLLNQRVGIIKEENRILKKYLLILLEQDDFYNYCQNTAWGGAQGNISPDQILEYKIPMPPKEIQEKIVKELEKLKGIENKISDQLFEYENKIKKSLKSSSKTTKTRIGDILTLEYGSALPERDRVEGEYPVIGSNGIVGYHNTFSVKGPSIIVGRKGSAGKITWIDKNNFPIDTTFYVNKTSNEVDYKYIFYVLKDIDLEKLSLGAGVPGLNRNDVYNQNYNFPSLEEQQKIISQIKKIEDQISKLSKDLQNIRNQKAEILIKYL